ncbi:hypothetical protein Tco_1503144, partial [Tanacetum coccineum]
GSHDQMNLNQQTIAYCLIFGLEIDTGWIIFSDLIHKLQIKKKNRESNICYSWFLSLIFENLLGENYISNDLTLVKLHTIIVALTSHMLKVAKLFQEPEQSLIPPSREVNNDDTADKSLSKVSVQSVTQPKAPTDLKTKKKRIPPSSKPKSPHKVRVILPKKQVAETQHAEVTMAIADTTKILVASELAEEQVNQPSAAKTKKLWRRLAWGTIFRNFPKVETVLDVVDKLNKAASRTPIMHDSEETTDIQEDSDYESMPEDDLRSVSEFEAADFDDTQGNDVSHSDHIFQDDNAFAERLSLPDHMDHICEEVSSLHSKLRDMESFIIHQVSAEIKSSLPALVSTDLQEQLPGLLSATLKDCLPLIIQESLQSHIPASSKQFTKKQTKLNKKVKSLGKFCRDVQSMQTQLNDIQSLLESAMIVNDTAKGEKNKKAKDANPPATQEEHQSAEPLVESQGEQPTDLKLFETTSSKFSPTPPKEPIHSRVSSKGKEVAIIEEPGNELVRYQEEGGSNPKVPKLNPFITPEGPLYQEEYNNQIKEMKRLITLKAQAQKWTEHEAKKVKMMEEFNHQISFRADQLPITKMSYVVNPNKEATMKIIRGDNPLNLIVHPNFKLKTLRFSECLEAKRLGLPPPPALATFRITVEDRKRKRTEFLKEAFVIEDIRVDGIDRNLIPPPRVIPIQGLVINKPESRFFFMNGNTNIAFQRESEFHLTTTVQLIRIQNKIKVDSEIASEITAEYWDSEVMKGLSECKASESNVRHIQVKDIVKEVEDHLKTYSSSGMDIICDVRPSLLFLPSKNRLPRYSRHDVLILNSSWYFVKCWHGYAVSSLMDTTYWLSEQ